MKKGLFLFFLPLFILFANFASSQIIVPISWNYEIKKISDCEFDLIFNAKIDDTWHLYGQRKYALDGPMPAEFIFEPNSNYERIGKVKEIGVIKRYDAMWEFEVDLFEHTAKFIQKIKVKSDKAFEIKGQLFCQCCTEEKCTQPPTDDFVFKIEATKGCKEEKSDTAILKVDTTTQPNDSANSVIKDTNNTTGTDIINNTTSNTVNSTESTAGRSWLSIFILGF